MNRIAYLLLEPPRYSETFILNELVELYRRGLPHTVFCLRGDEESMERFPMELRSISSALGDPDGNVSLSLGDVDLLYDRNAPVFEKLSASAFEKYRERQGEVSARRRRDPLWRWGCAVRLAAACGRLGISHVHAHYADTCGDVARMAGTLGGVSYSLTGHAKDVFTLRPERLSKTLRGARFAIGCSGAGVDHMRRAAPDAADRIHLVHHGLAVERWPAIARAAHAANPPRLLCVGRLTPKKGFDVLVKALGILRENGREVPCEIVGEGREREKLERTASGLGVAEMLSLPGRVDQKSIRERMGTAPIFVMPSVVLDSGNQDGLANAMLEAMASGLAVVASDIPAFREIIDSGRNGVLVRSGDADSLAKAIHELACNPEKRCRLGEEARRSVEPLTLGAAAEKIERLFQQYVG